MRCRGFTLIETLVAIAVLSVGLLGAAAMLLASLHVQADARREVAATQLLVDIADRIRVNRQARGAYAGDAAPEACVDPCAAAQLAAADRAWFALMAQAQVSANATTAIEFVPAIGPIAPDRYILTLRFAGAGDDAPRATTQQVLLRAPVAG